MKTLIYNFILWIADWIYTTRCPKCGGKVHDGGGYWRFYCKNPSCYNYIHEIL